MEDPIALAVQGDSRHAGVSMIRPAAVARNRPTFNDDDVNTRLQVTIGVVF